MGIVTSFQFSSESIHLSVVQQSANAGVSVEAIIRAAGSGQSCQSKRFEEAAIEKLCQLREIPIFNGAVEAVAGGATAHTMHSES